MKKVILTLAIAIVALATFAQAPQQMSYQTVIRDNSGALVASHSVGMRFSILQGSSTGRRFMLRSKQPLPT
jgi:hypothetical protein